MHIQISMQAFDAYPLLSNLEEIQGSTTVQTSSLS